MNLPMVSVGIPVYKGEDTLLESLLSLLCQSYKNLEIIVVDDCSPDRSFAIASQLASSDTRISLTQNQINKGAAFNFNYVLSLAHGKYFFWHAQDDLRYPDYVARCVELLESHSSAVFCHSRYIDKIDSRVSEFSRSPIVRSIEHLIAIKSVPIRFLTAYSSSIGSTAFYGVFLRSALLKTPLWENYIGSDISIFHSILLRGDLLHIPEVLFEYRARPTVRDKFRHAVFLNPNNVCNWKFPRLIFFYHTLLLILSSPAGIYNKSLIIILLLIYEFYNFLVRILLSMIKLVSPSLSHHLHSSLPFHSSFMLKTGYSDH
jgi:glycosyltransferase involved in cell wall biosynthesis